MGGTDGSTNERTNERTDIRITIYPRNFVCGGYKKSDRISLRKPKRLKLLQHVLCSSEKGRRSSSNFELKNSECSSKCSTFQYGDVQVNQKRYEKGRLGDFSGPQRCILPRTNLSTTQTVPAVLLSRKTLPVQSNAV